MYLRVWVGGWGCVCMYVCVHEGGDCVCVSVMLMPSWNTMAFLTMNAGANHCTQATK